MNTKLISKFKYLILVILVGLLLIPKLAFALIPVPVIDLLVAKILGGNTLTESIEEWAVPMGAAIIIFFIIYMAGIGALLFSSWFLQVSIEKQADWISTLNPMTLPAWNFTVGLANLLLVFILLIIAFGFILKIESIQARKTLPRLIIIALLMNFSLVFVRALFDITNIVYNTILNAGGGSFINTALEPFFGGLGSIITNFLIFFSAILAAQAVPIPISAFAQIFYVVVLFPIFFLPNIIVWIFQTFAFFFLSSLFLLYAFLFLARVFIIQILAILSPIAFLALILPQTRAHWEDWLKHLTSWLLLGVFLLFFFVIGFKGMIYLIPTSVLGWSATTPLPLLAWLDVFKYIFYYFAIFTYLGVVLFISKKYLPQLAEVLIGFAQQASGFIMTMGLKPFGRAVGIQTAESLGKWEGAQEFAEKLTLAPPPTGKFAGIRRLGWGIKREVGMALGPRVQEFRLKRVHEAEAKWAGKGTDRQEAARLASPYLDVQMGILKSILKDENFEDALGKMGYKWQDYGKPKEREEIRAKFQLKEIYELADNLKERAMIRTAFPDVAAEFRQQKYKETAEEAMKRTISAIKPEQAFVQPLTVLVTPGYLEGFVKYAKAAHYVAFASRFRQTGEEELERTIKELAKKELVKQEEEKSPSAYLGRTNPELFDYMRNSLVGLGFINLPKLDRDFYKEELGITEIEKTMQNLKEKLEEAKGAGDATRMEELKKEIEDLKKKSRQTKLTEF
jgi:hypothetical protein